MALTPRLRLAAELCGSPHAVIDVGCDHAYLCVQLIEQGVQHAFASDIRPGPLEAAKETIRAAGLEDRITPMLCPGLEAFGPEDADAVVICGMGGETIAEILAAAPWTSAGKHKLILQPMTQAPRLRKWLRENGYAIRQERLAKEGKRLYCLMEVWGSESDPHASDYGDFFTESLRKDPLFPAFVQAQTTRYTRILQGQSQSEAGICEDEGNAAEILNILKEQAYGIGQPCDRRSGEGTESNP